MSRTGAPSGTNASKLHAPSPAPLPGSATSLIAAAHYRERLHQSAFAAERRVADAQRGLDHARSATQEAKRDQSAIEKLIERAEAREAQLARGKATVGRLHFDQRVGRARKVYLCGRRLALHRLMPDGMLLRRLGIHRSAADRSATDRPSAD